MAKKPKLTPPVERRCKQCKCKKVIKEFRTNWRAHDGYTKTCIKCITNAVKTAKKGTSAKRIKCKTCKSSKLRSEFSKSSRAKNGRMSVCTKCYGASISKGRKEGSAANGATKTKRKPVTKARMQAAAKQAMVIANGSGGNGNRPMTLQKFVKQFLRGFAIEGKEIVDISVRNKKCTVRYVATETFDI